MKHRTRLFVNLLEGRIVPATSIVAAPAAAAFAPTAQTVNLSASVTNSNGAVSSGTETFTVSRGTTAIGVPVAVAVAGGTAAAPYVIPAGTPAGAYTVSAAYSGPRSPQDPPDVSRTLTVAAASTATTAPTTTATTANLMTTILCPLTARVTSPAGTVSEGIVTFTVLRGTTVLGTPVSVPVSGGVAAANYALPASALGMPTSFQHLGSTYLYIYGGFTIQAQYSGTNNFAIGSTTPGALIVLQYSIQYTSWDPNDLRGPAGAGPRNATPAGSDWPYTVEFQNDGTGAARDVVVTGTLDKNLDPGTFRFDGADFGSAKVAVPAGLTSYQTVVKYHNLDGRPLNVRVRFDFDQATGKYSVDFHSVNPETGLPLGPGLDGLLPPDNPSHVGLGHVRFSARPKAGLAAGTAIRETASVVFDTNAPVGTPTVVNTVAPAGLKSGTVPVPLLLPATNSTLGTVKHTDSVDLEPHGNPVSRDAVPVTSSETVVPARKALAFQEASEASTVDPFVPSFFFGGVFVG